MVDTGDDAALAAQALRLLRDPALAERLTRRAHQECMSLYVWPAVRDAWLQLYARARAIALHGQAATQPGAA